MTDYVASGYKMSAKGYMSVAYPLVYEQHPTSAELSGIVINQNDTPTGSYDLDEDYVYQTFHFPIQYQRGYYVPGGVRGATGPLELPPLVSIPPLSGIQIDAGVMTDFSETACVDWRIDYLGSPVNEAHRVEQSLTTHPLSTATKVSAVFPSGTNWWEGGGVWYGLAAGTHIGAHADGEHVWLNITFDPLDISSIWKARFRIGIRGRTLSGAGFIPLTDYDNTSVVIDNETVQITPTVSPTPLEEGRIYAFNFEKADDTTIPSLLMKEVGSGVVHYAVQSGVDKLWYTNPNPLAQDNDKAYGPDGVNPITVADGEVSFRFRVLAAAPDGGIDCFGNEYRHVVATNPPENLVTSDDDFEHAFWLSKPNPSKFAVESLYFDMRDELLGPTVVDHILVDPLTPGVYFHVYYSNDLMPGTDSESWDQLLWTPVDRTFLMNRRETFALPTPIAARHIKIEFSHLQPRHYAPGTFQQPMVYRKHPKWVLDYYLALYEAVRSKNLEYASRVTVTYDALDLAYNYYLDDLRNSQPDTPRAIEGADGVSIIREFLSRERETENATIDSTTLRNINTSFNRYLRNPFRQGRYGDVLAAYAAPRSDLNSNYSSEVLTTDSTDTSQVSSYNREILAVEKSFPVMNFYLPCRHQYKLTQGSFEEDRGYFVGLKEVAFTREHYAVQHDHPIYVETAGDNENAEHNDFQVIDGAWKVYNPDG